MSQTKKNYIGDLIRWQRNQFQPGAYLGGDLPPTLAYPTRKYGYVLLISGLVALATTVWQINQNGFDITQLIGNSIIPVIGVLLVLAGIKFIRKRS